MTPESVVSSKAGTGEARACFCCLATAAQAVFVPAAG
jgi:hypothetical protein